MAQIKLICHNGRAMQMQKKFFLAGVGALCLTGLVFATSKLVPCQAAGFSCPKTSSATSQLATSIDRSTDFPVNIHDYDPAAVQTALTSHHRVILFFQASWCSTCALVEKDFTTHAALIPADVIIYRVNTDDNKELKNQYGVVAQDEMVELGNGGQVLSHWKSSERAVEEMLQNLK